MPQGRRDKGYSHWNPAHPEHKFETAIGVPRLIDSRRKAAKCIQQWAACPNRRHWSRQNQWTGEYENDVDTKPDGRSSTDLEIVEVDLTLI
jgi:hypothetical protein